MEQGGLKAPTPNLRAIDSQWLLGQEESVLFKGLVFVALTVLQWMPDTDEYMSNTNCTWWVI